jgi:hypothetical protein
MRARIKRLEEMELCCDKVREIAVKTQCLEVELTGVAELRHWTCPFCNSSTNSMSYGVLNQPFNWARVIDIDIDEGAGAC